MKYLIFIALTFLTVRNVKAESKIPLQLSFSIGSISTSFSESQDNLVSTDGTTSSSSSAFSGTASSMPLDLTVEYFANLKRSYFIKLQGPMIASSNDRYFSANFGINFYFSSVGATAKVSDYNFQMKLIPKLRYYAGPILGAGYLVYSTKSAEKNDVLFEIGGVGGVIYSLNSRWGLKGEIGFSRGVGVLVSSTIIKILLGTTYTIGD
jgi:hypothetical protein